MLVKKPEKHGLKKHKCWKLRCRTVFYYNPSKPYNSWDWDDSNYYKCPKCGKAWYLVFQDINVLGNFMRDILLP